MISLIYFSKTNGDPADPSRDLLMGLSWFKNRHPDLHKKLRQGDLSATHTLLAQTAETNLERIFFNYQGENWSPNGEARELIEHLGLSHTSMCVGDIVCKIDADGDEHYFFCDNLGWKEIY